MRIRTTTLLSRAAVGSAVAAAAVLAAPALASAAPAGLEPPVLVTEVAGNVVNVTITNPNQDETSTCVAAAIDSAKVPALTEDPTKLLEPGFVAWNSVHDGATAGTTKTYTTPPLADGAYAFIGGCVSILSPDPVLGEPQLIGIGETYGSVGMLTGSLGDIDLGGLLGAIVA
ncbi:hypothetical protein ERC79_06690 [Rhodococcus sp. ABRD24]|uniref:hypothetical protein n=1 Tax=Rhodococcus sp. ABRD24 TaxID=2507582 RepID=UPI0010406E07|nr:hypothetical protein [Rhodococcus sp. ABRD24]QBJ95689.1 hypothetical protein ERC79_06690 [Rhodococcus sp. ABRD24]